MNELDELKDVTRRAHEAIKDLRGLLREADEKVVEVQKYMHDVVHERIDTQVKQGLAEYRSEISTAIEEATDAVFGRFDLLEKLLMGEDKASKRKRQKSIPDLITDRKEQT